MVLYALGKTVLSKLDVGEDVEIGRRRTEGILSSTDIFLNRRRDCHSLLTKSVHSLSVEGLRSKGAVIVFNLSFPLKSKTLYTPNKVIQSITMLLSVFEWIKGRETLGISRGLPYLLRLGRQFRGDRSLTLYPPIDC